MLRAEQLPGAKYKSRFKLSVQAAWGSSPLASRGDSALLPHAGQTCGCSPARPWPRPSTDPRTGSVSFHLSTSIPSSGNHRFPLENIADPTSESKGGARPRAGQSEHWVPPAPVIDSGCAHHPQEANERLLWDFCRSRKDRDTLLFLKPLCE